ncbi:hypothetical protein IU433_22940 [Nocardia puris]|uniref:hypothetical protein n=1 Tax=Nocardia puris TaxID=208602 RepID=UPI0018938C8C|nr:hypothetical protein [Nocardia puris]MBF6212125.1 hypothetical protein [Nocardia puris]MBF6367151.1 hypothetical protein [Nocardia puris]MBF6461872.1 hypothetical protein [Nocardia puris]
MQTRARGMGRTARITGVALIGAALLVTTACLGDETSGTATPADGGTTTTTAPAQPPAGAPAAGRAVVREIDKTGWYDGFEITVDTATVVPDEYGGADVLLGLTFTNTTLDDKMPGIRAYLQVGDEIDGGAGFDHPTVPAGGSADGKITTSVAVLRDADRLLDSMTVVYGESSGNQTKIPLRDGDDVESVEPRTLDVTGELVQDHTTVLVTGATLAPSYGENERGKMDLGLRITLIGDAGVPAGGANIYYQYFTLTTPDGQTLAADFRGPINELLAANQTIDNPRNSVVFVVPEPATGDYVLTYDALADEDGSGAPTFEFTID